ncbi:branched-chain amino acid transport system ATP-binding protein/branched-chain amino acid transport system permease protein [Loktanella sp. PT4BL]|uniref:Lipopolysaccharide export system ATP-binding protein LptB n=1 Tax=Yoonia vestfoldensis TaxID=245188 RepID=A0A1Y0EGK6_9RHOB|nr:MULTISPECIES: ABC transporter ATP-binding protein [Rhodobacterales]ARU02501.1 lipopolysaccharide export system ATP-binding protein LptB [Yoonia vestfoldensis]PXW66294.1 branched-chain amino acid transport system ATP-binding protein/branched-chain amino acid transport system permease protein [Loktanella sp. PT4BL]HEV8036470.1 ABC transporter ATP-binding protein [Yoonia sp.]
MSDIILSVENVAMDFDGFRAVGGEHGLSFNVNRGGFLGLIGPNGAGKSTTFNLISGVLKPTQGRVAMNGVELSSLKAAEIAGHGLGRTFQTPRAFPSLSVIDNVIVGSEHSEEGPLAALFGRWRPADVELHEKAEHALERVGLADRLHDSVANLSGGELRMLEVARQLNRDPSILLLDEPTAGVDPNLQVKLSEILVQLHADGTTLIVVEHNLAFLLNIADSVVVLQNGALLAEGDPDSIRHDPAVISAYLGADHET